MLKAHKNIMKFYFVFFIILLAREDLQQQEPDQSVLSYLFAQPARMEGTLKYYITDILTNVQRPLGGGRGRWDVGVGRAREWVGRRKE